jgi:hypothetical protein
MRKKYIFILFLLFTFLFWFSRLWNFERLTTFHSDQGTFFLETWQMVQEQKPRLIGLKVSTKEVLGRAFFTGPLFYYFLAILGIITNWNPSIITKIFLFFWWLTGLGIYHLVKKNSGNLAGLTAYGLFAVCPFLISFSRIVWNSGLLPLIAVLFFASLYQVNKKSTVIWWFLTGLFLGLGLNLNYAAFLWFPLLAIFFFWGILKKKWGLKMAIPILAGFVLGELPLILFELRHNFYNIKTILFFLQLGVLEGRTKGPVTDYHFIFALLPLFFLVWGKLISLIEKNWGFIIALSLSLMLFFSLTISINWQQKWGTGMPKGWTLAKEQKVAKEICDNVNDQAYEIAQVINGDTRAHDLRFFLEFYGCRPLGVEQYPSADILFLITTAQRPPEKETVWEVQSIRPFKKVYQENLKDNILLYKLTREKSSLD